MKREITSLMDLNSPKDHSPGSQTEWPRWNFKELPWRNFRFEIINRCPSHRPGISGLLRLILIHSRPYFIPVRVSASPGPTNQIFRETATFIQVNINGIKNGKNKDYLGFMIFPKSVCGKGNLAKWATSGTLFCFLDFIAKVMDGTVQFDFMDKFHNKNDPAVSFFRNTWIHFDFLFKGYYDSEAGFKHNSADQSLTIQWK